MIDGILLLMCGIIGIFGNTHNYDRAQKALEKIAHRGTSNFELKSFDKATIGTNRLPIVGRNTGIQPISDEDENIWAILNGEIFNFVTIKKDLEQKGYRFKTESDTEVLVQLYKEYGSNILNYIDSEMFSFIIYDVSKNTIFAARDPLGVKPLYYANDIHNNLYIFSELKEVADFDDIKEIHTFPSGTYFLNGVFTKYFSIDQKPTIIDEQKATNGLAPLLENAVKKRVQTDLPIAVLLSGGVDSSLVMELANQYHPDVTAMILGTSESEDYKAAIKLCTERNYKYKIVTPDPSYFKELDDVIYYAETYEPNVIRHCFANHICSKAIAGLGINIALVGEGSDEIFCGYNEFTKINPEKIGLASQKMTETLENGHLQRVDRMSMWHTIETRVPFLDTDVVKYAFTLAPELKAKDKDSIPTTKYILRKTATKYLPEYIAWRYKAPFANGAGMNVGSNYLKEDGEITQYLKTIKFNEPSEDEKVKFNLQTLEDRYYFSKFKEYHYDKLVEASTRALMKDALPSLYK